MMHSLIFILSMCWHECHDRSMDQLMENKHGQRMIRKHSSRNGSVRTQRSSKPRRVVKTRKAAKKPTVISLEAGSSHTGSVRAGSSEGSNRFSKQDTKKKMANEDVKDCSDKVTELSAELIIKESDSERPTSLRNEAVDFKGNEKLIVASNGLSKKQKEESHRDVESA